MKKFLAVLVVAVIFSAGTVYAGHVENTNCLSAEYGITSARTGATDAADIALYNPAGTVFLPHNGLYINFSIQGVYKKFENEYGGNTYEQDEPSALPVLNLVYRRDNWATFLLLHSPAGTGGVNWENGSATTAQMINQIVAGARNDAGAGAASGDTTIYDQSIEASSVYIGITLGQAYKVANWISFSVASRYITSDRNVKAKARFNADILIAGVDANTTTVDLATEYEYEAQGWGGIFGINIRPFDDLNIGIRYETVTVMDFKYKMKKRDVSVTGETAVASSLQNAITTQLAGMDKDGKKLRYDLPATFSIGAEYTILPGLAVMAAFDYFFAEDADWETEGANEENIGDGWEISAGAMYRIIPALRIGAGIQYTSTGVTTSGYSAENPVLDNWTFSLGGIYSINQNLDVTLSGTYTYYLEDDNYAGTVTYKKTVASIAAGVQYRLDI